MYDWPAGLFSLPALVVRGSFLHSPARVPRYWDSFFCPTGLRYSLQLYGKNQNLHAFEACPTGGSRIFVHQCIYPPPKVERSASNIAYDAQSRQADEIDRAMICAH